MKHRLTQYILIIAAISAIAGSYFYFQSRAAMTVNQAGLTSIKLNTAGLTSIKINSSQAGKLTNGLVGHWTFDGPDTNWTSATAGTTADKSPAGTNTGTLTNMSQPTTPAIGKVGQALNFDGSDDRIIVTDPVDGSLDFGTGDFSVAAWIKTSSATRGIIDKLPNADGNNFHVLVSGAGKINFMIHDTGADYSLISNSVVANGQWHHIGIIVDWSTFPSGTTYIYIDGTLDNSGSIANIGTSLSNSTDLTIGDIPFWAGWEFDGSIDEVRLYNRALSASEITELYNMGR